jgi:hypothetical protein
MLLWNEPLLLQPTLAQMSRIYLFDSNQQLHSLTPTDFESEDLLQTLLASHPELIDGTQINPDNPRRWLLVQREYAVADELGDRRSLDHLLLDQDGIPTFVEVKRSSDTRIRREVVGQMLDYAANAIRYCGSLQATFLTMAKEEGIDPEEKMRELLGREADLQKFWETVENNLQLGNLRLLFVADQIPPELQRIIEYLNEQLERTEVLGVEIKRFTSDSVQTLVPKVVGRTPESEARKAGNPRIKRKWTESDFLSEFRKFDPSWQTAVEDLLSWAKTNSTRIWWGEGTQKASFQAIFEHGGYTHYLFDCYARNGKAGLYLMFDSWNAKPPFESSTLKTELVHRLNQIPGVELSSEARNYPSIPMATLADPDARKIYLETMVWFIDQAKAIC